MALIEIPNVYHSDKAASPAGRRRPAVIGEPIVAVDLINTVAAPGSAAPEDLLSANGGAEAWWQTEGWCTPSVCGNRVRVARHHRHAGGG